MGIVLSSNFTVNAGLPLDSRSIVNDIAERDLIPNIQRYEGMEVYVKDIKEKFQLQDGITNLHWVSTSAGAAVAQEFFPIIGFSLQAIVGVNTTSNYFEVLGDITGDIITGSTLIIENSTGNDGNYEIVSSFFDGVNTEITVLEAILDNTIDGDLLLGTINDLTLSIIDATNGININVFKDEILIQPNIEIINPSAIRITFFSPLQGSIKSVIGGIS